jgi:hypothetical protein
VAVTGRLSAVNALTAKMIDFGLYGVSERAGERREVAVETRITDATLRGQIMEVETRPRTVTVSIVEDAADPASPTATPSPTPDPQTAPNAEKTIAILLEGATAEQKAEFSDLLQRLPDTYSVVETTVTREGVNAYRVTTREQMSALLDQIVTLSHALSYELGYSRQTDDQLLLRAEQPEAEETPTPTPPPTEAPVTATADLQTS